MTLVSKFGIYHCAGGKPQAYYDHSPQAIVSSVEASLKALHTGMIDVVLVHRPSPFSSPAEIAHTARRLVREGKIRALGVSNYTGAQLRALQAHMKRPVAVNQVEMSLLGHSFLFDGTIDYAHETGMPLMAWSPMAGGGLTRENTGLTEAMREVAAAHGASPDSIAYAWIFSLPVPVSAVAGSMQWNRMEAAVKGASIQLSAPEWFYLLEAAAGHRVP